ncbi:MAG TPA: amino acid racemase [Bacteroidota bacterium]
MTNNSIGVVGGVGPYAGLDLVRKIFDQTVASSDQEHLPVVLISHSNIIDDRTAFLLGASKKNPAQSIVEVLRHLDHAGASVAGIPCNTAHAPSILDVVKAEILRNNLSIRLVHMIEETALVVQQTLPNVRTVGLLSTTGTAQSKVYQHAFERRGLKIVLPSNTTQQTMVHPSIYDREYGIKARSNPVTERARSQLLDAIRELQQQHAEAVILGCTEIPLAVPERSFQGTVLIDPTVTLARALIRDFAPEKLKPFSVE